MEEEVKAGMEDIIVGIDFGTTCSGVALARVTPRRKLEISSIRGWPGGRAGGHKVSSDMVYLPDGTFKCGFQTSPGEEGQLLQYIKLTLDPHQKFLNDPLGLEKVRSLIPERKTLVDVIVQYLQAVKDYALKYVANKTQGGESQESINIRYYLTVPVIWSDPAKMLMLEAATAAGIGDADLVIESDAAALYCLNEYCASLPQVGDTFIIADCGGGTVDLVSYRVIKEKPSVEYEKVAVGGSMCGSIFLNRKFEALIKRRLETVTVDMKGGPYYKLIEELKCNFMDTEAQLPMYFPIPGLPDYPQAGVINGFLKIDSAEIRGIFEPIIEEILRLIQEQIDTLNKEHGSVSTVFLLGGLGSSSYVYKKIQEKLKESTCVSEVLQPPNAWNAVARGAVIYGLQKRSKQACANYGVKVTFDLGAHLMKNETWHNNPVKWFVKKGDIIPQLKVIKFKFCTRFQVDSTSFKMTIDLLFNSSNRFQLGNDSYLQSLRNLQCNLEPFLQLKEDSDGWKYYEANYIIVMRIEPPVLDIRLDDTSGKSHGTTTTTSFK